MKPERSIMFSEQSIRKILSGEKTQTRRPAYKPAIDTDKPIPWLLEHRYMMDSMGLWRPPSHFTNLRQGARLWVKETWGVVNGQIVYKADKGARARPWHPPMYMPRDKARITLRVDSVHVEPLHEISAADLLAEGVTKAPLHVMVEEYKKIWQGMHAGTPNDWDTNPMVVVISFRRV